MSYYSDLTPYEYLREDLFDPKTLNVGWLDSRHDYTQGETSEEFHNRLYEFCLGEVRITRGFHGCDFCRGGCNEKRGNKDHFIFHGEIRVIGKEGKIYAAPTAIYHYVVAHHYKPPDEFIQAVMDSPLPGSPEFEALKRDRCWE